MEQRHGGPFTDQQVSQLVAFIRNWEPTAPDRRVEAPPGDPTKGLVIFNSTGVICHGENGQGSERAPALNDPAKLAQFDDTWYTDTIAKGHPAKGMPTWGTVLSPQQIRDLVALLRAWQRGESVNLPSPSNTSTMPLIRWSMERLGMLNIISRKRQRLLPANNLQPLTRFWQR